MKQLFLHVGYPKTGSTTLQKGLFSHHPEIAYLGRPFDDELLDLEKTILAAPDGEFTQRLPHLIELVQARVSAAGSSKVLLSHEGFLRSTRHGGHDVLRTAERIKRVFAGPEQDGARVKVLVCLRRQQDLFLSHFVQFVRGDQEVLDAEFQKLLSEPRDGFASSLYFDKVLGCFQDLFGDALEVLLFERLIEEPEAHTRSVCDWLGVDAELGSELLVGRHDKRKRRQGEFYLLEARNTLTFRMGALLVGLGFGNAGRSLKQKAFLRVALSPSQLEAIGEVYAESNRRAQEGFGLPLEQYGYSL